MAEVRANAEAMQAEALKVTPLREMATDPEKVKKLRTKNARRSQASPSGKTSVPSSSVPSEIANREGSRVVHIAIARIVSSILNENRSVPGVSVPLNEKSASPSLTVDPDVTENVMTSGDHGDSPAKNNVDPSVKDSEVRVDDVCNETLADKEDVISDGVLEESPAKSASDKTPADSISDSILEETPEKPSGDNLEKSPVQDSENLVDPPVIDLDEEFSDNDLIANVNPSIAKRMMRRKGKQAASQSPVKEKVDENVSKAEKQTKVNPLQRNVE